MLRVTTESGSVYQLDIEKNIAIRERSESAATLENDGREHYFKVINLNVGEPMIYSHYTDGYKARTTTPVVSIEEI